MSCRWCVDVTLLRCANPASCDVLRLSRPLLASHISQVRLWFVRVCASSGLSWIIVSVSGLAPCYRHFALCSHECSVACSVRCLHCVSLAGLTALNGTPVFVFGQMVVSPQRMCLVGRFDGLFNCSLCVTAPRFNQRALEYDLPCTQCDAAVWSDRMPADLRADVFQCGL